MLDETPSDSSSTAPRRRLVHLADFRGNAVVLTFFFTRCPLPTYCPLMNRNFAQARALLLAASGAPSNWQFLSVSFDPAFDTPQTLAAYLGLIGADFTVTEPPELLAALRELAERYQRAVR